MIVYFFHNLIIYVYLYKDKDYIFMLLRKLFFQYYCLYKKKFFFVSAHFQLCECCMFAVFVMCLILESHFEDLLSVPYEAVWPRPTAPLLRDKILSVPEVDSAPGNQEHHPQKYKQHCN